MPVGWSASDQVSGAHFQTAEELDEDLSQVGLTDISVCAIEGPDGLALEQMGEADEDLHHAAFDDGSEGVPPSGYP
jgi:hypothetical protein